MHENANIAFQVSPFVDVVIQVVVIFMHLPYHFKTQETHALIHQILDVQPRMAGSSGGKTSDEIVYELAENILGKIPDKLDLDKALPEMFEVSVI